MATTSSPTTSAVFHCPPQAPISHQAEENATTELETSVPGTQCGPCGKRLVVQVVDELGRRVPDRVWASISRSPYHLSDGFRDITMGQLANAVNCASWLVDAQFGNSKTFDVIAYLGVSDVRYGVFTFATIKTGHQIMIPSVRNSPSQNLSVFEAASCNKIFYTVEMEHVVTTLKDARPELRAVKVPSIDELIHTPSEHYNYDKTWAEARTDPIIIAHSSGSTGNPKPTTITNGVYSVYDNHREIPQIPGRKIQGYTLLDLDGDRFFNPFPPFHLAGLFAMTIMPIFYSCAVALGPEEKPPSGEILSQAMKQVKIRAAWCPPSVIEQLVALPGGFEQAAGLDWMMYTGGPLAPAVGDRLSHVTDLCQLYGSTETGPHSALVPLPENWNYFEWHPLLENKMDSMGDGTFEMVVHKDPSLDWIRHLSQAYPDLETWRTNDLFVQAPHNPKLWRFVGRRDDVIVLSNGEKFNPVNMEGVITGHPLVKGAVIIGTARFQASLIVEPAPGLVDISSSQLIDEIWPTVEEANSVGPAHGRIFRSKVTVGTPDKPFLRAGKGTIIRGRTTQLYAAEVDKLYDEENKEATDRTPSLASPESIKFVTDFVRACVVQLMPTAKFTNEDDLFVLGMDSLQTLELLKVMQRGLKASLGNGGAETGLNVAALYANPTVGQISRYLYGAVNGLADATDSGDVSRSSLMASIVEKYTADLPKSTTRGEALCVALTGSTGSLGTHLLEMMLSDKSITKIYCLNRSADALQRHQRNFNTRGKKYNLESGSVKFLTVKFGESRLGLADDKYRELTDTVDVVIHNAWKVDFNHQLASFDQEHIKGVRDLVDLTLSSPRQPHLFFVSSLSSVGNWAARQGNAQAVPERIPDDFNVAMAMGYGESKHVSERIISAAVQSAGLRGSILRIGQIAGPLAEDGGEWNKAEWFPSLIATSKVLCCLPDTMNTIDWIPVDTLATIIGEIVHQEYRAGTSRVFNFVNPHEANWQDLVPTIQKSWQPAEVKVVPFTEWLDKLRALGSSGDPEVFPALKLLDFYTGYVAEAGLPRAQRPSYQTSNCTGASRAMADLCAINSSSVETWLRQWGF